MTNRTIVNLCLIYKDKKMLLGKHTRGPGVGRWNGFGGKVYEEDIEDATRREVREEVGLEMGRLEKIGIIEFTFVKDGSVMECHFFKTDEFSGIPMASEEMETPTWFDFDKLPYEGMWPDDRYWIPFFLAGKKFKGEFTLGENDQVLEYTLQEVNEIQEMKENKIRMK